MGLYKQFHFPFLGSQIVGSNHRTAFKMREDDQDLPFQQILESGASRGVAASPERWGYEAKPGMLYTAVRAISSRVNANYDAWPTGELEENYKTFVGKPIFLEHMNEDISRTRGVIIGAKLHKDSLAGQDDWWIEILKEVDMEQFPKLGKAILDGKISNTSMGCSIRGARCSVCDNFAEDVYGFCSHIPNMKGIKLRKASGQDTLCFEYCEGPQFFEDSYVFEPADESAYISDTFSITATTKSGLHVVGAELPIPEPVDVTQDPDALEQVDLVIEPSGEAARIHDEVYKEFSTLGEEAIPVDEFVAMEEAAEAEEEEQFLSEQDVLTGPDDDPFSVVGDDDEDEEGSVPDKWSPDYREDAVVRSSLTRDKTHGKGKIPMSKAANTRRRADLKRVAAVAKKEAQIQQDAKLSAARRAAFRKAAAEKRRAQVVADRTTTPKSKRPVRKQTASFDRAAAREQMRKEMGVTSNKKTPAKRTPAVQSRTALRQQLRAEMTAEIRRERIHAKVKAARAAKRTKSADSVTKPGGSGDFAALRSKAMESLDHAKWNPESESAKANFPKDVNDGGQPNSAVGREEYASKQAEKANDSTRLMKIFTFVEERERLGLSTRENRIAEIARFESMSDDRLAGLLEATREIKKREAARTASAPVQPTAPRMPSLGRTAATVTAASKDALDDDMIAFL